MTSRTVDRPLAQLGLDLQYAAFGSTGDSRYACRVREFDAEAAVSRADAVRLGPADAAAEVTAGQLRNEIEDLMHH
ncbi:hypothetical protein [Streptomyces malaysiensis]|uniref:hypothetical protein n=1 Tax=Streptomyces malaysiensis TaxID=92644 RepID=UPI0036BFEF69